MDSCSVRACQFSVGEDAQREYRERLMVPVCCHLIVFMSAFYRYFVYSLAVSCHFAHLSVYLLYLSSQGPSAGIKEIKGCNTYFPPPQVTKLAWQLEASSISRQTGAPVSKRLG